MVIKEITTESAKDIYDVVETHGERWAGMSACKKFFYGAGVLVGEAVSLPVSLIFLAGGVTAASLAFFASAAAFTCCKTASAKSLANYGVAFLSEGLSLAICPLLYWIPVSWFDPISSEITEKQKNEIPVLLVHGWLHNSSAWHRFKQELLKDNPDRLVFTIDLGANPFVNSIEGTYQKKLSAKIQEIKALTNANKIHLVGHSMGGMVSSVYACNQASKENGVKVESLVTIGSPLEGTPLAKIALDRCGRAMRHDSPLVMGSIINEDTDFESVVEGGHKKLTDRIDDIRQEVRVFHFGTKGDEFVPCSSAICSQKNIDSQSYKTFSRLGHVAMVFSPTVIRTTIAHINNTLYVSKEGAAIQE